MLLNTSSSKGDSCSVEEYTRPRGTLWRKQKREMRQFGNFRHQISLLQAEECVSLIPYPSAVDNNTTRIPPPAAFARSTMSCRVRCKFVGSKSTVLAMINVSGDNGRTRLVLSCLLHNDVQFENVQNCCQKDMMSIVVPCFDLPYGSEM